MSQSVVAALFGGALIGLSAGLLLVVCGRIAGVSGIVAGTVFGPADRTERHWRALFCAGLLSGGLLAARLRPEVFSPAADRSTLVLAIAGALIGFGARLGNGCTSGHGVCGLGRLSARSFAAAATFVVTGMLTVGAMRWLVGAP